MEESVGRLSGLSTRIIILTERSGWAARANMWDKRLKTLEQKGLLKMDKVGRTRLYSRAKSHSMNEKISSEMAAIRPSLLEKAYNYWFQRHKLKSERQVGKIPLINPKNKKEKLRFSRSDFSLSGVKPKEGPKDPEKQENGSVPHSDNLRNRNVERKKEPVLGDFDGAS